LGVGLDVDSAEDLQVLLKVKNETLSKQVLQSFKITKS
jgi:2-phospho-L-lactate guanylyltransferase (CobY/MobA/RfbA family)